MAILPPSPDTLIKAGFVRATSANVTPSGKLKLRLLPSTFNPTVPAAVNPPSSTRPLGANREPSFNIAPVAVRVGEILPPTNNRLLLSGTERNP